MAGRGQVMGVDKSPTDTYPMRLLTVGETIAPRSMDAIVTVLACWLIRPSDVDAYAMWTVLCLNPDNTLHPYAVWTAFDRPEGWTMADGDYCRTLTEAVTAYYGRVGEDEQPD
jgi:hypothetical protein